MRCAVPSNCKAVGSVEVVKVKVVGQKLLFLPCQVRLLASTDANIYFLEERLQLGAVRTNTFRILKTFAVSARMRL